MMTVAGIVVTPLGSVTVTGGMAVVVAGNVIVVACCVRGTVTVVVLEQAANDEIIIRTDAARIFNIALFINLPHLNRMKSIP
jgi:hypothetical protein